VGTPKLAHTPRLAEDEMVDRIRRTLGGGIRAEGLRDDAAVLAVPGGGSVVVSTDSVVAGVHVDLALCAPADVGWKALMGALSDLAAMGARPLGALVALCVPGSDGSGELALGVMAGVAEATQASGCPVVGGDVSSAPELVVTVTVLGTVDGGVPVARAGARAGDVVLLTGPCGGSAAGLRVLRTGAGAGEQPNLVGAYRRPVARLAEGEVLRQAGAHAMIDISDGLALDLHRLADASGVGFALHDVPVAEGATRAEALGGGEDYELLVAMGPEDVARGAEAMAARGLRAPRLIGVISADPDERRLAEDPLARLGWQHVLG
jgi:thiamine-monophosphate kinase